MSTDYSCLGFYVRVAHYCKDMMKTDVSWEANSEGSDKRPRGAFEGHTRSRHPFLSRVWGSDGASQRRLGRQTTGFSVSLVETRKQQFLFFLHARRASRSCVETGEAESLLLLCRHVLWIHLHWFGPKDPVCDRKQHFRTEAISFVTSTVLASWPHL